MLRATRWLARLVFGAPVAEAPARTVVAALALWAAAAVMLVAHAQRYGFVTDDAYISFVYARNLAEHGELVFNLGDRVEGYSNFSWTVLLAAGIRLGVPPELSSLLLGAVCAVATLAWTCRLCARALPVASAHVALPAVLLALSAGFACWTSGGLESALFALLCLAALEAAASAAAPADGWRVGALVGLAALTRPEGLLLGAAIGAHALAHHVASLWRAGALRRVGAARAALALPPWSWRAALAAALLIAPHLAWRLWYYGWPLPNTYYVKAHGPWQPPELAAQMWQNGAYYLWVWIRQSGLWLASPLVAVALLRRPRALAPALWFSAAYAFYAVSVGGDFMGLHRFILPLFPIAAISVVVGVAAVPSPRWRAALALGLVAAHAVAQQRLTHQSLRPDRQAADRGIDPPAFLIAYTRDRAAIGRALAPCLRGDDFAIVGGAGAQPYYARLRAIDVFGLVSEEVAHQEPRVRARAGHTKWASDALLAKLEPTLVFSCYALHGAPGAPELGCAAPWRSRGYRVVTMRVPGLVAGPYYSFLARADRALACAGVVASSAD